VKFLSEYRDQKAAEQLAAAIRQKVTRPWTIMEICGGQTHTIVKSGLEDLLPREITLVHGPGCPVCVTPIELIDKALAIAKRPDAIFTSFGDMLRVPGSSKSLFDAKAEGADVRIAYSPLDALKLAKQNPEKQVVFFAVGFETTAPANAMAAWQADHDGIENFSYPRGQAADKIFHFQHGAEKPGGRAGFKHAFSHDFANVAANRSIGIETRR